MLQTRALLAFGRRGEQPTPTPRSGPVLAERPMGQDSLLRGPIAIRQGKDRRTTHFARGLDTLPDAEETDKPDEKKAESEVPLQRAGVVDSRRQAQHVAP